MGVRATEAQYSGAEQSFGCGRSDFSPRVAPRAHKPHAAFPVSSSGLERADQNHGDGPDEKS